MSALGVSRFIKPHERRKDLFQLFFGYSRTIVGNVNAYYIILFFQLYFYFCSILKCVVYYVLQDTMDVSGTAEEIICMLESTGFFKTYVFSGIRVVVADAFYKTWKMNFPGFVSIVFATCKQQGCLDHFRHGINGFPKLYRVLIFFKKLGSQSETGQRCFQIMRY